MLEKDRFYARVIAKKYNFYPKISYMRYFYVEGMYFSFLNIRNKRNQIGSVL